MQNQQWQIFSIAFGPKKVQLPHILFRKINANYIFVLNKKTNQEIHINANTQNTADELLIEYAADNSGSGLGSLIHYIASMLGFKRCSECSKRQIYLNNV